ncbi:MAG: hypothetical protein STSR0009_22040 [Methanoregula sp.]
MFVVGAHTANPMRGDFSVEISNLFWMEDGEFAEPIRNTITLCETEKVFMAGLPQESMDNRYP